MIERTLGQRILQMTQKYPIVSVTGPRQSGKTTLLKHLFPDYRYVTLEDPDMQEFALNDPRFFLKTYNDKVILDEVQRTPDIFSYLQGVVDETNKPGRYLLSGSQNFLLMQGISQSLAGRVSITRLLPFSYREANSSNSSSMHPFEWVWKGGYPRIYDQKINPPDYYSDYIQTYLERDVRSVSGIRDFIKFETFLRLCANRVGSILDQTNLATGCGIDVKTVSDWLSVLESSFVIFRLPPYYRNFNKRLIKRPKLYFYDTGLACNLCGIDNPAHFIGHEKQGALFENAVIVELLKQEYAQGKRPEFYYWRDSNKREVDLIIEKGGQIDRAIEIKSSTTYRSTYFTQLQAFSEEAHLPVEKRAVIYAGDTTMKTSQGEVLNIFS